VASEYGNGYDELMLDWNESPLGPPPAAVERVIARAHLLHKYPRGLMEEVAGLAAQYLGIDSAQILLTSGVDEAIDIAMSQASRGLAVTPGFDFEPRVRACDRPFCPIPLGPDWQPPFWADQLGPGDAVFIAQPGNPTGNLIGQDWIDQVRASAGYFFRDETYQEFCSAPSALRQPIPDDGLMIYRSFAKAFGLAGLRVGCLIGHRDLITRLEPFRRFMPIDAVSLNAAAGALAEPGFVAELVTHILAARPRQVQILRDSGLFLDVRDTETNFVIARLPAGTSDDFVAALARHRVRVKACDFFGLDDWIRVGVGSWDDQARLAEVLAALRAEARAGAS
jgi:histidinol-phosphate/aromatic aminotransferase/cobyric acid decarboxylase-like protein